MLIIPRPAERREIVIRPDRPWEQLMISFYLTVLDDGGKLRMWYICRDKTEPAERRLRRVRRWRNWIKPNLGIVEYEGNKDNNLVGIPSLEGTVYRDRARRPRSNATATSLILSRRHGALSFAGRPALEARRRATGEVRRRQPGGDVLG